MRHPGNKMYRSLIKSNKSKYIISIKEEKTAISRLIVSAIRKAGGRFLERAKDETWYDIGDSKATEKTSQGLREGQPKLRKKLIDSGEIDLTGSFHTTLSPLATSTKCMHKFPHVGNVSDSSSNDVHMMNKQSSIPPRSFDSFVISRSETMWQDHPRHQYHQHEEIDKVPQHPMNNNTIFHGNLISHPCRQNSSTITPPPSPIPQSDDSPLPLFCCQNDEGRDIGDIPEVDILDDNIDDNSIMTFEMDSDELFSADDSIEMLPSSIPLSAATNHALHELTKIEPIQLQKFRVVNPRDGNDCYHHRQQQQQHEQQQQCYHSDLHSDYLARWSRSIGRRISTRSRGRRQRLGSARGRRSTSAPRTSRRSIRSTPSR